MKTELFIMSHFKSIISVNSIAREAGAKGLLHPEPKLLCTEMNPPPPQDISISGYATDKLYMGMY